MMVAAHNIAAMNANRVYKISSEKKKKRTEKLSSGYRINRSADDAAGLSISEKMRQQIKGLNRASTNAQEGISLCQVADGALAETMDMMHRITELSVQSANGTNSQSDRDAIQHEVHQLLMEMDRIAETTTFNGEKVFADDGDFDIKNSGMLRDMSRQNAAASGRSATATTGTNAVSGTTAGVNSPLRSLSWSGNSLAGYYADTYTFDADTTNGITITGSEDVGGTPFVHNSVTFPWNTITNQNGDTLDTLADGQYSISENGITFSFDIAGAQSLDDIAATLDDVVATATITTGTVVSPAVTNPTINITSESSILSAGGLGLGTHTITADSSGISLDGQTVSWSSTNLSSVSAGGGALSVDFGNGVALAFDVEDGTTEAEAAAAFNNTTFTIERDPSNITFSGTGTTLTSSSGPSHYSAVSFSWSMMSDPYHDDGLRATGIFSGADPVSSSTVGTMTVSFAGGDYATGENTKAVLNMGSGNSVTYNVTASSLQAIRNAKSQGTLVTGTQIPVSFAYGNSTFTMNFEVNTSSNGSNFLQTKNENYTYSISGVHEGLKVSGFTINGIDDGNSIAGERTVFDMSISGAVLWQAPGTSNGANGTPSTSTSALNSSGHEPDYQRKAYGQYRGEKQLWIQSKAGTLEGMVLKIGAIGTRSLGLKGLDVSSQNGALDALDRMEGALNRVSEIRSEIGAQQNRLESAVRVDDNTSENTQVSESKLRDTDISKEMVKFMKDSVLSNVGESMMAQINQNSQGITNLLQ